MLRKTFARLALAATVAVLGINTSTAKADACRNRPGNAPCHPWDYGQNSLFHNYYVPGVCGGVPAKMYVSPMPVPAHVGHTYITNEAMMPHEYLYNHHRSYYRYTNEGRGMTRTSVHYYSPPFKNAARTGLNAIRIAR